MLGTGSHTFTYNQADEITAASPAFAYTPTFDADGNQTEDGSGTTYSYNTFNQLDSITPHGGTAETLAATGTSNSNLVTDGSTSLVESTLLGTVGMSTSSTSQKILRDPTGRLLYLTTPTASYNYLVDTQGNIAAIAASSGTLAGYYTYDPYGNATITNLSGTITTANPFRYNAGYTTTSGPTHYGARYQNPAYATWTQTDTNPATIAQPQQYDRYPYAGDNPVTNDDPNGECGIWSCISDVADDIADDAADVADCVGNIAVTLEDGEEAVEGLVVAIGSDGAAAVAGFAVAVYEGEAADESLQAVSDDC